MKTENRKPDNIILIITIILIFFGAIMIASAGVFFGKSRFDDAYFFLKHQVIFGIIPGLLIMFFVSKINYLWWKKISVPLFFIAIVSLVLLFIPGLGTKIQGASRWLALGPISFQPSEFMKLAIILYLAVWLEGREGKLSNFKEGLVPFIVIIGLVGLLIIKQPDMGSLGLIILVAIIMFFASGVPLQFIFYLFFGGGLVALILIKLEPYRMNRLTSFLDPSQDPQGIGYQINQALIAVGTGGFLGLGLGHSRQKFNYLPEPVGDSIFAVVCEELGFVGGSLVVVLFLLFALRGYKIAQNAPDTFSRFVAIGITSWVIFQAFINIMAITGFMPLTGIPLPFISYGSTSLIFVLTGVGILLNISKYSKI